MYNIIFDFTIPGATKILRYQNIKLIISNSQLIQVLNFKY